MKLHLDIDCFFAAAHRINNPQLNNIPIAVGGRSNLSIFSKTPQKRELSKIEGAFTSSILSVSDNSKTFDEYFRDDDKRVRGIITTSSYEARAFGVKTAMSVAEALRWCPNLVVIPPNYSLYHELSHKLKLLLQKQIPTIEQFSIDEFFCDVTGWINDDEIEKFAYNLKQQISDELGLPVSIGIADSKWIAKLATNDAKPYGVKIIYQDGVDNYVSNKPVEDFCGIGKGYQTKLQKHGIYKLGDIKKHKNLFYSWGKFAKQLYHRVQGDDNEKVIVQKNSTKSIGLGRSFDPLNSRDELKRRVSILCRHLSFLAYKGKHNPMTFSLNMKYQYGEIVKAYINTQRNFSEQLFKQELIKMFNNIDKHISYPIIQINITLSNFTENKPTTLNLFTQEDDAKQIKLTESIQSLRNKFGIDILKSAGEL